jgi:hypothetical protein
MNGFDIRAVQTLMGHKDTRMTMRYSHLSDQHLQNAVSTLDGPKKPESEAKGKQNGNIEEKEQNRDSVSDCNKWSGREDHM